MKILDIRILPPIAIGRLGSSEHTMDAFNLKVLEEKPLDFRHIIPKESLQIDEETGEITAYCPDKIIFKDAENIDVKNGKIRPVAPFLEVFAITDENPELMVPLTTHLLEEAGLSINDISCFKLLKFIFHFVKFLLLYENLIVSVCVRSSVEGNGVFLWLAISQTMRLHLCKKFPRS